MNTTINIDENSRAQDVGADEEVSVTTLSKELQEAVDDGNEFCCRCANSYDTRHCIWTGQDDSGKKKGAVLGEEPFPWEGSSDTRIRLCDEVINDNTVILSTVVKRSQIQAVPMESLDAREAGAVTIFLKWLRKNVMREMIRIEVPLLANWQETYGHSVMAVSWDQEVRKVKVPTALADMQMIAETAASQGDRNGVLWLEMLKAVFDESREDDVAAWLISLNPLMTTAQGKAAVRRLRLEGMFEAPRPLVTKNQPCLTALRPFRDVFYPANTTELARARWIAVREVLSPGDLRSRILNDEYDENAVQEACDKFVGTSILDAVRYDQGDSKIMVVDEMKGMLEVFCFYRRVTDKDGFTTIYETTFCPGSKDALKEDESMYAHNEYPFVEFWRVRTERQLLENRAVPELCNTHQNEVKTQRDFRVDRSSIAILPPVEVPLQRPNLKLTFGPAKQIPARRPGENRFMELPRLDADTVAIEQQTRLDVDNYFARWKEGVHPTRQNLYTQAMTDDWLGGFAKVFKQTLMLCRQYMSDQDFQRVTGVALPFALDEETILKQYDVILEFSAADLNTQLVTEKLEVINKAILPGDTMGVLDRVALTQWAMRAVDPTLAEAVIREQETATNAEIEDEQVQFSKLFAGTEPEMKPGGQNYALRLQVLQTIMQRNPNVRQRYAVDEIFRTMMDARFKHFQFQLQQRDNAMIGRMGAAPGLSEVNAGGGPNGAAPQGLGAPGPGPGPARAPAGQPTTMGQQAA